MPHGLPDQAEPVYRALPVELFSGTSGVALFLAQLHAAAPDARLRRSALGAISQSLSRIDTIPASDAIGLFTGVLGVAHAAAVCGDLLAAPELYERALVVARGARGRESDSPHLDLISGRAGATLTLLTLTRRLDAPDLMEWAQSLGHELLEAVEGESGWRWESGTEAPDRRVLTGLSHGASGAALALGELHDATGEARFAAAARAAIDFERQFFDPLDGNWRTREPGEPGQASRVAWCHGAPGIGLARLRAWQRTREPDDGRELDVCIRTTSRWVVASLRSEVGNYSLCHGLAGNADVLALCAQGSGSEEPAGLARRVAEEGIARFGEPGRPWPCGGPGGETPGLMLGLSGIGLFYLRVHSREVASPLLPVEQA